MALRDLITKGEIDPKRKPEEWAVRAVDRSGLMGILFELDTAFSHLNAGKSIQRALSGKDPRFRNDSGDDALKYAAGPAIGSLVTVVDTMSAINGMIGPSLGLAERYRAPTSEEWRNFRGILPWNTHFLMRHGFDQLEDLGREATGTKPRDAQPRRPSTRPPGT